MTGLSVGLRKLLVVVMLVGTFVAVPAGAETPIISAPEASTLVEANALVVLDIRRPEEWAETGIAKGAWPVSMHTPEFPQQLQTILTNYRPEQIALICATGGRTAYVTEILERNGISGIADLSEGMFGNSNGPGWLARGLPVVSIEEATADFEAAKQSWD